MLNQNENNTSQTQTPIPTMNKELPKKKSRIPMYLLLVLVVTVAFAGIGISLRQYLIRDTVAPTAPDRSQASIDKVQDCSVSFDVAPPESGINCVKQAYRDELSNTPGDYELTQVQTAFAPGDTIVYSFVISNTGDQIATVTATDSLSINIADDVYFNYDFLDSNCGANAYQDRTITCTAEDLPAGGSETFTFRIQLSDQIDTDMTLSNMVQITDGTINNECSVDVSISTPIEAYCNETCSTDNDCVESNHSCIEDVCRLTEYPNSETCEVPEEPAYCNEGCSENSDCVESNHSCIGDVCRLTENPSSETCEPQITAYCGEYCATNGDCIEADHTCYNNECRLATNPTNVSCNPPVEDPTPTPETAAYCGEYCATNSDCIQGDHICYFNQCRLAEYPDRQDCTAPTQQIVTTNQYVEPTPTVGCNQDCLSNRDCSNNDHICYEGSCRLSTYPASTSCTIPAAPVSPDQPKMPEELPKSGSDDLINWIKAGIGILGAGALLLLL
jgi:uncharacterized repeat protein (TIGR01451 family)